MRFVIIMTVALAMLAGTVCLADETTPPAFVNSPGYAPYFTRIDSALSAAPDTGYVVIEFYTDW